MARLLSYLNNLFLHLKCFDIIVKCRFKGKILKILVLVHEKLIPPDKVENEKVWSEAEWKTEYDVVSALEKLNHKIKILGVSHEVKPIRTEIERFKPNIVFNLLEEFKGESIFDQNIVSYLEILGVRYTGCNPRGLILGRDKALCKKILKYHGIPTPDFTVYPKNKKILIPVNTKYPLFVKTINEEASLGISLESIVKSEKSLKRRIEFIHSKFNTDALVEDYIPGEEFYVGVVGNSRVQAFPVWQLHITNKNSNNLNIATRKVKWDFSYRKKIGVYTGKARNIDKKLEGELQKIAKQAYEVLGLTGYARIDFRVTPDRRPFILEVNPNPDIGYREDLAASAEAVGMDYTQLIAKILNLAKAS